jgi:hypothetical protein
VSEPVLFVEIDGKQYVPLPALVTDSDGTLLQLFHRLHDRDKKLFWKKVPSKDTARFGYFVPGVLSR